MKFPIFAILLIFMFGNLTTIAFSKNTRDTKPSFSKDKCLLNVDDFQLAEKNYSDVISKNANDTESLYCRGIVRIEIGKYKEAISDFTRLIGSEPSEGAYLGRADAWLKLGGEEKSDLDVSNAFKARGNARGYYLSARVLQGMKRYQDAITDYIKSIEIDPDRISSLIDLAWLHATCEDKKIRDGNEALNLALRAINKMGKEIVTPWQYATLAAAYAELGDFDNARLFQEKAIVKNKSTYGSNNRYYIDMLNSFNTNKPWREPLSPRR